MSKVKIDKKIVGYAVKQPEPETPKPDYRRESLDGGGAEVRRH